MSPVQENYNWKCCINSVTMNIEVLNIENKHYLKVHRPVFLMLYEWVNSLKILIVDSP